jgi:hypothetical protein
MNGQQRQRNNGFKETSKDWPQKAVKTDFAASLK